MQAIFYQKLWDIVGNELTDSVLNILNNDDDLGPFNQTFICLIPKVKRPSCAKDFRLISLCNVILKLVTKTIANRLKMVLSNLIGHYQSAFVPGRLIIDNALIAFHTFHYLRKKTSGKVGHVGIKLDMAKAW